MQQIAVGIVSLISLFIVTFIVGLLPLKLRRKRQLIDENRRARQDLRRRKLLSLCSCFASGAFFATTMLNLIPLVEDEFQAVFDHAGISTDFPVAEFAISVGFFLILTLEQIILAVKKKPSNGQGRNRTKSPLLGKGHPASYGGIATNDIHEIEHISTHIEIERGENDYDYEDQCASVFPEKNLDISLGDSFHMQSTDLVATNDHGHDHNIPATIDKKHQLRSYLLLMALLIHASFEGLAIGLSEDIRSMMQVLGAVIIHKCVLAFSIGSNLVQKSFPLSMVVNSSFLFSAASPVGFGIGILLTNTTSNLRRVISPMFQAIASGTFLYVTFFEIFFHELGRKECHNLFKVLMMILGFSLFVIGVFVETLLS